MRCIWRSIPGRLRSPPLGRRTEARSGPLPRGAIEAVAVEQALHATYLKDAGFDAQAIAARGPSPDCLGYTSYLIAAAYHEPWEVLVAALLPCFWLYWDVGNAISRTAAPDNPYRAWIDTYSDQGFGDAVRAVIAITDEAAAGTTDIMRGRMLAAFTRSCQWEWLFWDSAYQKRGWPVTALVSNGDAP